MSPGQIELLKRYEERKLAVRELEKEMDEMKADIVAIIPEGVEVGTDNGVFSIASKRKWKYSSETERLTEELAERKKNEERDGTAHSTDGAPYVVYKTRREG